MNNSTQKHIEKFRNNLLMRETGVIFRNLDTGQTYLIEDCGPNFAGTILIDLHPSEWLELEAAQIKEDKHWDKIRAQIFKEDN